MSTPRRALPKTIDRLSGRLQAPRPMQWPADELGLAADHPKDSPGTP
jgi:hypothetical protein